MNNKSFNTGILIILLLIIGFFFWQRFLRDDFNLPRGGDTITEIIGFNDTVDWQEMIERLKSLKDAESPIVE